MKKTGTEISLLGFGCMRFPMDGKNYDMPKVREMISRAYESGVNYFDTAYVYGEDGMSEKATGEALKQYRRGSFYVADKLPLWLAKEDGDLDKLFQTSLDRLGMDYIDFYLLHSMTKENWELAKKFHAVDFCKKLRSQGKIRYIGFSFHDTPELLQEIVDSFDWDFVQIQLNYLDWDAQRAKELYEIIEKKGMGCIIMEPVRGGGLANPPEEIVGVFKAERPELSVPSWALRFCGSLPNVNVILSGMSDLAQVNDNLSTFTEFKPLSEKEYDAIHKAVEIINSQPRIGCTGCRYCMPCPAGVDIPAAFSVYNDYMKLRDNNSLKWQFSTTLNGKGPDLCLTCGACMEHCPQHLEIPNELLKVAEIGKQAGI